MWLRISASMLLGALAAAGILVESAVYGQVLPPPRPAAEGGPAAPLPAGRPAAVPVPEPRAATPDGGAPVPRDRPEEDGPDRQAGAVPLPGQKPAADDGPPLPPTPPGPPGEATEQTQGPPLPAARPGEPGSAAPEAGPSEDGLPREKPSDTEPAETEPAESEPGDSEPGEESAGEPAPASKPSPAPPRRPLFADDAISPACIAIEEGRVSGRPLKPIEDPAGCVVPAAYAVSSVGSERSVELMPEATLNCEMTDRLDRFVEDVVEPAARDILGSDLVGLGIAGSYVCRPRNGEKGATPSEHGEANAIDIARFILADGREVSVAEEWAEEDEAGRFLREVHGKACGPFTTVIGPDGDAYHSDHIHLDLARRGAGGQTTFCQ